MNPAQSKLVLARIVEGIPRYSYSFAGERAFQDGVSTVLTLLEVPHQREVKRGSRDRFDFLCDGSIVIETKIKGSYSAAMRQSVRYLEHEDVHGVVIVTTRLWAADVRLGVRHHRISGKPVHVLGVRGQAF